MRDLVNLKLVIAVAGLFLGVYLLFDSFSSSNALWGTSIDPLEAMLGVACLVVAFVFYQEARKKSG